MFCSKVETIVNGLEKQHGSEMSFQIVNYQQGDSPARIKKYDLGKHGMVIIDQDGNKVWSEPGHKQSRAGIDKAIKVALAR